MFHILVADDDINTGRLFRAVLEGEGYTVSVAKNGMEALEIMDKEVIDLVVLDVMMPEMDGYEFTKILRDANNTLPILMISAKQMPEDMPSVPKDNKRVFTFTEHSFFLY